MITYWQKVKKKMGMSDNLVGDIRCSRTTGSNDSFIPEKGFPNKSLRRKMVKFFTQKMMRIP